MKFLLSLVIPVYKVEEYIETCLLSCLKQNDFDKDNYEIILVDDGSPDKSIIIAKDVEKQFPAHHLKIITRVNGGLSAARNTGLEYVEGEYVWFIDSDDWIQNDALVLLQKKLKESVTIYDIVTFKHKVVYANGKYSDEDIQKDFRGTGFDFLEKNSFLSVCRCIYNVEFLRKNSLLFKEGVIWEDSEFNLRAYALAENHYYFAKALYFYLRRNNSITTQGTSYKMIYSWFDNLDSISLFFKDKTLTQKEISIINKHRSKIIIAIVAGLNDLSKKDKCFFRDKIKKNIKYYSQFFYKSKDYKIYISGFLIAVYLPVAELLYSSLMKHAIRKGEGNI